MRSRAASAVPAQYEGRPIRPDPAVVEAMAPALRRVRDLQATTLGVSVEAPIRRAGDPGSPLGNLFADALREALPGADVAVVNNATRGLRADLPDGPMTFGRLYDVFPFDNRLSRITLAGADLNRWLAEEIRQGRRRALGISGVRVRAELFGGRDPRRTVPTIGTTDSRQGPVDRRDDRFADAERDPCVDAAARRLQRNRQCPRREGSR